MGMFFHERGGPPAERPADPAVRRANLRRIGPLFTPYRLRLTGLLALIVAGAGLGVLPPSCSSACSRRSAGNDTRRCRSTPAG